MQKLRTSTTDKLRGSKGAQKDERKPTGMRGEEISSQGQLDEATRKGTGPGG